MPFGYLSFTVEFKSKCPFPDICCIVTKPHRPAEFIKTFLLRKECNDMRSIAKFLARSIGNTCFMTGILDSCQLEPKTKAEEWDLVFTGKPDCFNLSFDTPFSESSGDQDAVKILESGSVRTVPRPAMQSLLPLREPGQRA